MSKARREGQSGLNTMKKIRLGKGLTTMVLVGVLAGCSSTSILPRETHANSTDFRTYEEVMAAYAAVIPATTRMADLAKLGFDVATAPNVEVLATPDISNRFMVQGLNSAGHVPPVVEACIAAQDRCSGLVFHCQHFERRHVGNALLDIAGFKKNILEVGWSADVLLVLQDGRVIYKIMSGKPRIENARELIQPLGILQDIAKPDTPKKQ